ncbi:MAG: hypothetical protein ACRD1X_13820 [Vicinamibacteria bacterium]
MRFTDDELDELRAIYRDEFGEDITREDAYDLGLRLVTLFDLFSRNPFNEDEALHS